MSIATLGSRVGQASRAGGTFTREERGEVGPADTRGAVGMRWYSSGILANSMAAMRLPRPLAGPRRPAGRGPGPAAPGVEGALVLLLGREQPRPAGSRTARSSAGSASSTSAAALGSPALSQESSASCQAHARHLGRRLQGLPVALLGAWAMSPASRAAWASATRFSVIWILTSATRLRSAGSAGWHGQGAPVEVEGRRPRPAASGAVDARAHEGGHVVGPAAPGPGRSRAAASGSRPALQPRVGQAGLGRNEVGLAPGQLLGRSSRHPAPRRP